jgi:acetyl-CoA acetyltransferase
VPGWKSDALIVDAIRTPIGKRNGTLSQIRGDELTAQVLNALVSRQGVDPAEIEEVQLGCVTPIGEQGWNIGRMEPLVAGWPDTVCGTSVDRQCGSSMQTNFNAAAAVWSGAARPGRVGNSSQIVDGAAAVLIASERKAADLGLEPRARFVAFGLAGVDPHRMLDGNPQACERVSD